MATPTFVRAYIGSDTDTAVSVTIDTTGLGSSGAIVVFMVGGGSQNMTTKAFSTPVLGGSSAGWTEAIAETVNAASNNGMMGGWVCLNPASSASVSLDLAWTTAGGTDRIAPVIGLYSDVDSYTAFSVDNDAGSTTTDTMTNAAGAGNLTVGAWSHGSNISSVTSGTTRGSINNAATDYANGCIVFIEGDTAAFSSASADSNIGMQVKLVGTGGVPPVPVPVTVTAAGTGNSATSTATLAFNCGDSFAIGDVIVVQIAADNNGASGVTSLTSVTDAKSHTYVLGQRTLDPGAAAAGQTNGIAYTKVTTAMITTDQITVNFSPNTTAKAAVVWKLSPGIGYRIITPTAVAVFEAGAATGTPSITTSSIPIGDVVIAGLAVESNGAVTADADSTNGVWSAQATATGNTGTLLTSSRIASQAKIVTATATQTYNPTLTSADCIAGWIAFDIAYDAPRAPIVLQAVQRAAVR